MVSEEESFAAEISDWAQRLLRPFAAAADESSDIPAEVLGSSEILNVMRLFVPVSLGGGWRSASGQLFDVAGKPILRVIAAEAMGYADSALFVALPGPLLAGAAVFACSDHRLQAEFASSFVEVSKPAWAAFAMSEPAVGSDVSSITTTAAKRTGGYLLNGTKWFVGNGARATWIVVFATTEVKLGRFGVKAFLVDRRCPGIRVRRRFTTLGLRAVILSEITFEDCWVDEGYVLGSRSNNRFCTGFDIAMEAFRFFRPIVAALAVGTADALMHYTEELGCSNFEGRVTAPTSWGSLPNINLMKMRISAARNMCRDVARLQQENRQCDLEISMAKTYSASVCERTCLDSMDLIGRPAIIRGCLTERLFRDIPAFDIMEGTGDVHRLLIARNLKKPSNQIPFEDSCNDSERSMQPKRL